jgi:translation initiation factor 2 subunit 1
MLVMKKGFPEESDLVLCTVTKIHYHSVFVSLDEYEGKQGMIHISEISPGRIRNINDYVQEGKKIVCKVLNINKDRGHIDLSLRRVSQVQKRTKIEEIKQEQKAEKIIEFVAKQKDMKTEELFIKLEKPIFSKFSSIHEAFESVVIDDLETSYFGLSPELTEILDETIKQRIKPPKVEITSELVITSYDFDGVGVVQKGLLGINDIDGDIQVFYLGGGKYSMRIESEDFKAAEKILKQTIDYLTDYFSKSDSEFSYTREEGKKANQ